MTNNMNHTNEATNEANASTSQSGPQPAHVITLKPYIACMISEGTRAQYMQAHYSCTQGMSPYTPEVDMVPFPNNYVSRRLARSMDWIIA